MSMLFVMKVILRLFQIVFSVITCSIKRLTGKKKEANWNSICKHIKKYTSQHPPSELSDFDLDSFDYEKGSITLAHLVS